jgi:DNA-binding transcriptional regulator LsrR (DeoR family)
MLPSETIRPLKSPANRAADCEYAETVANNHTELTMTEVASKLGISRATLYRMIARRRAAK